MSQKAHKGSPTHLVGRCPAIPSLIGYCPYKRRTDWRRVSAGWLAAAPAFITTYIIPVSFITGSPYRPFLTGWQWSAVSTRACPRNTHHRIGGPHVHQSPLRRLGRGRAHGCMRSGKAGLLPTSAASLLLGIATSKTAVVELARAELPNPRHRCKCKGGPSRGKSVTQ